MGRQPWTVYGLLRTADSVSPSLTGADVVLSLAFYVVVYLIMFPTGIAFMAGLVRRGPQEQEVEAEVIESGLPNRPFESAARIGIAISLWPMIVPYHYTLWEAASSPSTQAFMLIGTLFLLPIILMYTAWSYWVFRGKVSETLGYH